MSRKSADPTSPKNGVDREVSGDVIPTMSESSPAGKRQSKFKGKAKKTKKSVAFNGVPQALPISDGLEAQNETAQPVSDEQVDSPKTPLAMSIAEEQQEEFDSSSKDVQTLQNELNQWKSDYEALQTEHDSLKTRFATLEEAYEELQAQQVVKSPKRGSIFSQASSVSYSKGTTQFFSAHEFRELRQANSIDRSKSLGAGRSIFPTAGLKSKFPRMTEAGEEFFNIRKIMTSNVYRVLSVCALLFALFGGSLFILFDVPDDPGNAILDIVMLIIMLQFFFEIGGIWLIQKSYRCSWFFWMDVVGTISMMFEISWMLGSAMNVGSEISLMVLRTARTARLGARLARFLKLQKILISKGHQHDDLKAEILTRNLSFKLSTKVSMLTISLVMLLPIFRIPLYPYEDLSMKLWSQRLEEMYRWELEATPTNIFEKSLQDLDRFYAHENYEPYRIEGFSSELSVQGLAKTIQGQHQLPQKNHPNRKSNQLKAEVRECGLSRAGCSGNAKAKIYFDFTTPHQLEAAMTIALVFFMMTLMVIMSYDVNRSVEELVVTPLERMLKVVRVHAAKLLEEVSAAADGGDEYVDDDPASEVEVLEFVIQRLARLVDVQLRKNVVDKQDLKDLDKSGLAIMDMMQVKVVDAFAPCDSTLIADRCASELRDEVLNSWTVDALAMTAPQLNDAVAQIFFASQVGVAAEFVEQSVFMAFHNVVKDGYQDLPYHCYFHACDILHVVFRILTIVRCSKWMTPLEEYALLVAALCHDVGHLGKTNPFLVETGHMLALRYNDVSPLENMHCATLFQICSDPSTDAFAKASVQARKDARAVCIKSILHTDNAKHFGMVKHLSQCYEMNMEYCDEQAAQEEFSLNYMTEVLQKEKQLWFELFLHLADVSNPSKPFEVCQAWAFRVLDEFFSQGDEEKQLGMPIGMLNDRDTVDRPGSQHGFINFLVAPLVANTVKLFPPLHDLLGQLADNLGWWRDLWVEESKPSAEDIAKKDHDVEKLKETAQTLRLRMNMSHDVSLRVSGADRMRHKTCQLKQNSVEQGPSAMIRTASG